MGSQDSGSSDGHPGYGLGYGALLLVGIIALTCAFASRADGFVYWANGGVDGTIGRANNDGTGVDNNFITGARMPCGVAVDASYVYWANDAGTIGRANLDGSGVNQFFITGLPGPCGPAVDATHIYWSNQATGASDPGRGSIGRANLDGTDVRRPLFGNQSNLVDGPCGTAIDSEFLYWTNSGLDPKSTSIGRSPIPDPLPDGSFVDDAGGVFVCWPSVTSSHLYWSVFPVGILRLALSDPAAGLDVVTDASASGGTAIHASRVYWANSTEGTISRANLDGSSPDFAFITGAMNPRGLAVDSGSPGPGGNGCEKLTLGEAKKNKRKGTAKLPAEVPCAGALRLSGKGLKPVDRQASGAGAVKLPVKARGKKKKRLRRTGKVKAKAKVTFTPNGGASTTEVARVKLVKRL